MKKYVLIIASIILILFSSCNPDSNFSILYNKLHAAPTSDYRISTYVGDLDAKHIVLGTDKGITVFDLESMSDTVIVDPIARPILLVYNDSDQLTYVVYYIQNYGQDAALKAKSISVSSDKKVTAGAEIDAEFLVNGNPIDITTVYRFANQKTGEDAYTIQEREVTGNDANEERTINFYHYTSTNNTGYTVTPSDGKISISFPSGFTSSAVKSSSSVAPYIVGDGYIAYLDENESYRNVYNIKTRSAFSWTDDPDDTCPDNKEIIAFYADYNNRKIIVDNSGNIYVDRDNRGDFGSFPMDNRRSAYSTIVGNELFIGYKYGPEILSVNNEGNVTSRSTSDINDEDILGFKYYHDGTNGYYYVVTEEASVIRTSF